MHMRDHPKSRQKAVLLDILFHQITTFIKVCMAFVFVLKPKNKGHTNFYERCDLTKKYIYCIAFGLTHLVVARRFILAFGSLLSQVKSDESTQYRNPKAWNHLKRKNIFRKILENLNLIKT